MSKKFGIPEGKFIEVEVWIFKRVNTIKIL